MLPIFAVRENLIDTIRSHPVTIVRGSTGSGKTTQLPVMLAQAGFAKSGSLIIAEPRRAAAINVADYVAQQLHEPLGKHVGYRVRFESVGNKDTSIQFMTAGILLQEMLRNPLLLGSSVLIIDEVHENNVESDLLVSFARDIIKRRPDFRVVIMSATMDVSSYSSFFGGAPVIEIPGRSYSIAIHYLDHDLEHLDQVINEAVKMVSVIIRKGEPGDVLIFMPGRESIEAVIDLITFENFRNVVALPLYRDLEPTEQKKVYQSFPGMRKIVVSTNIAETSVTIENVRYVIDSGLIKNTAYLDGVQCLLIEKHSQSGCDQRSGRSGRVGPGICFRMFTEHSYKSRSLYSVPEIERADPAPIILYLQESGRSIKTFELIHRPDSNLVSFAENSLKMIGALSSEGEITPLGKRIANLPVDPHVGNLIIESIKHGCVREVLTFVSFLSRTSIFLRPYGKVGLAEKFHAPFKHPASDALTTLNVWKAYCESGYSRNWCRENFINIQAIEEAKKVRDQLARVLLGWRVPISRGSDEAFLKCIVFGFRSNLLVRNGNGYHGVLKDVEIVSTLPQSPLRLSQPLYIVAADLLKTKNCYALYATEARVEWLRECIPDFDARVKSAASIVRYPDTQLVTFTFTRDGDKYVTEYNGRRILKVNKGGKVETDKPYICRIVEVLGIPFAEVVSPGTVEKPLNNGKLVEMAEELATVWQCHIRSD